MLFLLSNRHGDGGLQALGKHLGDYLGPWIKLTEMKRRFLLNIAVVGRMKLGSE